MNENALVQYFPFFSPNLTVGWHTFLHSWTFMHEELMTSHKVLSLSSSRRVRPFADQDSMSIFFFFMWNIWFIDESCRFVTTFSFTISLGMEWTRMSRTWAELDQNSTRTWAELKHNPSRTQAKLKHNSSTTRAQLKQNSSTTQAKFE